MNAIQTTQEFLQACEQVSKSLDTILLASDEKKQAVNNIMKPLAEELNKLKVQAVNALPDNQEMYWAAYNEMRTKLVALRHKLFAE